MSEKKTPQIRFKGFIEPWEERTFNEIFNTSIPTNTLSRAMLTDEATKIKNIHYGDILVKFSEITYNNKDKIPFIINDDINRYEGHFLQNGDIIFADAAEDETAGKATELAGIDDCYVVSGLHTIAARSLEKFAPKYFGYYLNSNSYHGQLIPLMQGTKVLSISKSTLSSTIIDYPQSYSEQTRIGEFFKTLDNLISKHQRKYDKLRQLKKSLLEKMFPQQGESQPQIRFNGFLDDWEEHRLGKFVSSIATGKSKFEAHKEKDRINKFAILGSRSIIGYDRTYDYDGDFILTARVGENAGKLYRFQGKVKITDNTVFIQTPNSNFVFYLLEEYDLKFLSFGTGQPLIKASELNKLQLKICLKEEQIRIGAFFKTLDDLISAHQRELDKLKSTKKALLEKMFV